MSRRELYNGYRKDFNSKDSVTKSYQSTRQGLQGLRRIMAFPAVFNIAYYRGDTYEFRIYPKDSSGNPFPLEGYDLANGAKFTMSTERGESGIGDQLEGYARISTDRSYIDCAILPQNGIAMDFSLNYVYDVQLFKAAVPGVDPYPTVLTLLTGTISVTEQITGALEAFLS